MKRVLTLAMVLWAIWLAFQFATQKEMGILLPLYGLAIGIIAFTILWGLYAARHAASPIGRRAGLGAAILTVLIVGGIWGTQEFRHWQYRYPGRWIEKSGAQPLPVGQPTTITIPPAGKEAALVKVLPDRQGIYTVDVVWQRTGPDAGAPRSATLVFQEDGRGYGVQPRDHSGSHLWAEVPAEAGEPFYMQFQPLTWGGQTDTVPNDVLVTVTFRELQKAP